MGEGFSISTVDCAVESGEWMILLGLYACRRM